MATLRTFPSDVAAEHRRGLCPICLSHRVTIVSHVDVLYEVEIAPGSEEMVVVDELIAGSGWDDDDSARCSSCGWSGRVLDLAG